MKKYYILLTATAICALAACSKIAEQEIPAENTPAGEPQVTEWTYISAQGEEETQALEETPKSTVDNSGNFKWSAGDRIAVWSGDTYHLSAALEAAATSATFAFEGSIDAGRANFAVFPASLVFDGSSVRSGSLNAHDATSLKVTLPASYTLAQVQDNESPTPMIAVNEPGNGLSFFSVCALLRITVKNIPKDAAVLKVSFPGKKVQGEFSLSADGIAATDSEADGDDTITITDLGISEFNANGLVINVPVPIGVRVKYVRVGAYDEFNSVNHKINAIDAPIVVVSDVPKTWVPKRTTSRKVTATLPYFLTNDKTKRYVVFAPGNLQGIIKTKPSSDNDKVGSAEPDGWKFADNQYDALGNCNGNKFASNGAAIDLFAWIGESATFNFTDEQKWGLIWPNNPADAEIGATHPEKIKYSWAELFNGVSYPAGTWRLPNGDREGGDSSTEWQRLAGGRTTTSTYICTKATIQEDNSDAVIARGLIVFPDTFSLPYGFSTIENGGSLINYQRSTCSASHYADNKISLSMWKLLEEKGGCAFLPVTSDRIRSGGANPSINFGDAAYWADYSSSTQHAIVLVVSDKDYCTSSLNGSNTTAISPSKSSQRKNGCAVRLIRDVN